MPRQLFTAALFLLAAALSFAPAAYADDNIALSAWLAGCQSVRQKCLDLLASGYEASYVFDDICPPENLSEADAAQTELRWLENAAASNSTLAAGNESDAEWTALNTLWPCGN